MIPSLNCSFGPPSNRWIVNFWSRFQVRFDQECIFVPFEIGPKYFSVRTKVTFGSISNNSNIYCWSSCAYKKFESGSKVQCNHEIVNFKKSMDQNCNGMHKQSRDNFLKMLCLFVNQFIKSPYHLNSIKPFNGCHYHVM